MQRILEPSTWAGVAAIILGLKSMIPPEYGAAFDVLAGLAGSVAVVLRERAGTVK